MTTETSYFNPQGPHGPRRFIWTNRGRLRNHFNPQGPRGPRQRTVLSITWVRHFNPQGPHGPRPPLNDIVISILPISIHKALTGLDIWVKYIPFKTIISIHKALTGLDGRRKARTRQRLYFNPQGPHGPRPNTRIPSFKILHISIHKALTGLDVRPLRQFHTHIVISIHKALTGLDRSLMCA